jgi:lysophospholipase L1-like esterase
MRLVLINLAVFVQLLLLANIAAGFFIDVMANPAAMDGERRIATPAYTDKDSARKFFRDFSRTRSAYSSYDEMRREPFASETINIDQDGLRVTPGAPANPARLLSFFGGSTMWGTGVDDAHTIPALLQRLFPHAAVVNYGQSAFVSAQDRAALLKRITLGAPVGTAVFYDGINDVLHLCQAGIPLDGHAFTYFLEQAVRLYRDQQLGDSEPAWTATVGNLVRLAQRLTGAEVRQAAELNEVKASRCSDSAAVDAIADILWRNWLSSKLLVEASGGRFVAILQPVSSVGKPRREYLPPQPEWDLRYSQAYDRIRSHIKAEGEGWAYDFSLAFDGDEALYIDPFHVSARGNAIIAARMAEILGH